MTQLWPAYPTHCYVTGRRRSVRKRPQPISPQPIFFFERALFAILVYDRIMQTSATPTHLLVSVGAHKLGFVHTIPSHHTMDSRMTSLSNGRVMISYSTFGAHWQAPTVLPTVNSKRYGHCTLAYSTPLPSLTTLLSWTTRLTYFTVIL